MSCVIDNGLDFACSDRKNSAGLKSFFYVANLEDFTATLDASGFVSALTFASTKQLYKFQTPKFANDSGYEIQSADGTGNPSYKFMMNLQFAAADQASLNVIDDLVFATDLVMIMPTQGGKIYVYGLNNGVSIDSGEQTSGKNGTENNLHQLTFSGEDNVIYPEFLDTDYDTSITTLEGYLTPAP